MVGLRLGAALLLWAPIGAARRAGRGQAGLRVLGGVLTFVDGLAGHRLSGLLDVAAFKVVAVGAAAAIAALAVRRAEAAALAGVLALAGLLVSLPPPR